MAKRIFVLIASLLACLAAAAQDQPFQKGTHLVWAQYGLVLSDVYIEPMRDNIGQGHESSMGIPQLGYEYGLLEDIGPGFIGLGARAGFATSTQTRTMYESTATFWHLGAQASYHFDWWQVTRQHFFRKFDNYVGLVAGMRQESRKLGKFTKNIGYTENDFNYTETGGFWDLAIGGNLYLGPNAGIRAEFALNSGIISLGGQLRF